MHTNRNILVLGIGNILLRDEGAGVHALRRLEAELPDRSDITLLDGGTLSFSLADAIGSASHLVVLDSAELDATPGHTCVFEDEAMDAFLGGNRKRSVHEVGLLDLMAMARLGGYLPGRRALIGIQPAEIGWGEAPSPAIAVALPEVCASARRLIEAWQA
jgi:hydrogenase maturation protease